jgi:hypothetical protein
MDCAYRRLKADFIAEIQIVLERPNGFNDYLLVEIVSE